MTRPNGVNTNYSYDSLSHLLSVLHQAGASTIDGASYTVDATGNRTSKTDQMAEVTSNYAYDSLYELKTVTQAANTTENYTYDPVGNRLSSLTATTLSYNSANELTATPSTTYAYDANGNTTSKTDSTGTTTYTWDFENRLTSVTLPGTGGTVTFKYDPLGRRIQKLFVQGTNITATTYAYEGDSIAETTDGAGNVLSRYAQGFGIDEPLAAQQGATTIYYHTDGLGSITSLSNTAGAPAQTYTYDSFGKITNSNGSLANMFQYTARELDSETGLYFYRARYYDSDAGRFLNEDPIGFLGGIDRYTYVENNPVEFEDPFGLRKYKCTFLGSCYKIPTKHGPSHPPQKSCPLVTKAFNDFQQCVKEKSMEKAPGAFLGELSTKIYDVKVPMPSDNSGEISFPSVGPGDFINAAGDAYSDAIVECFKDHGLAALDPRFPKSLSIKKLASPTWYEKALDFIGVHLAYGYN